MSQVQRFEQPSLFRFCQSDSDQFNGKVGSAVQFAWVPRSGLPVQLGSQVQSGQPVRFGPVRWFGSAQSLAGEEKKNSFLFFF